MTMAVFAGFQTLLIPNIGEFCKTLNDFRGIPVKIHKILGEIHGFPVNPNKHFLQDFHCRPWGVSGYFLEQPNSTCQVQRFGGRFTFLMFADNNFASDKRNA